MAQDQYTQFLCHFDNYCATDQTTSLVDNSSYGFNTGNSNPFDMIQSDKKFGVSSLDIVSGKKLQLNIGGAALTSTDGAFCYESLMKFKDLEVGKNYVWLQLADANNSQAYYFSYDGSTYTFTRYWNISGIGTFSMTYDVTTLWNIDKWNHICFMRDRSTVKQAFALFWNGKAVINASGDYWEDTYFGMNVGILYIGSSGGATSSEALGFMDELRITVETIRHIPEDSFSTSFTLPTSPYDPPDSGACVDVDSVSETDSDYDSGVACVNIAASTFEGLDHLEGETVSIIADGIPQDSQVVVGGQISLPAAAGIVHVGLPYYSDFETLNIELGSDRDTAQGRKIKVGCVNMRFSDSRGGWLGDSFDDLYEAFTNLIISRNATELSYNETLTPTLNQSTVLYTGIIRRPLNSQYKQGGRVCFRQTDPLPVMINSVYPEVTVGGPI